MFKKRKDLDTEGLNEMIYLSKNILKLLFVVLIISIVLVGIVILKELGIFKIIVSILNVLAPLFIGFAVAWLFAPLVNQMTKKKMSRILASIIVYIVFVTFLFILFKTFIPVIYNELNELLGLL